MEAIDDLLRWLRLRPIWWTIKRPWCWMFGHKPHELPGEYRRGHNTHFCERCLLAWEIEQC